MTKKWNAGEAREWSRKSTRAQPVSEAKKLHCASQSNPKQIKPWLFKKKNLELDAEIQVQPV